MLDHRLRTQVDAALRHALARTGPEQYHRDCALVLEVMAVALRLDVIATFHALAQHALAIGWPQEAVLEQEPLDGPLMLALEAVGDILASQRVGGLVAGALGMARWLYVCLQNGDRERLSAMASAIESRVHIVVRPAQPVIQELH